MATPDVRVRLSAEGVQEVVAALRKVRAEATQASSKTGGVAAGIESFAGAVGKARSVLGALGIAVTVAQMASFARRSAESADATGKFAASLGISARNMSVLAFAAKRARVDLGELEAFMARFAKRVVEFQAGQPDATSAFRALRISPGDLRGKDLAQQLDLVAGRLAKLRDGNEKTYLSSQILGKGFERLLPLMRDLGAQGLDAIAKKAQRLGLVLDDRLIANVQGLNDQMDEFGSQLASVGVLMASSAAPALIESLKALGDATSDALPYLKELLAVTGWIALLFLRLGTILVDAGSMFVSSIAGPISIVGNVVAQAMRGNFAEAERIAREGARRLVETQTQIVMRSGGRLIAVWDQLGGLFSTRDPAQAARTGLGGLLGDVDLQELFNQRAAVMKASLEKELALIRLQLKLREESEQRSFEQAQFSAAEYYKQRVKLAREAANAEIAVLAKRRLIEAANPDARAARTDVARTDAEIAQKRLELRGRELDLAFEEMQALRRLGRERLRIEQEVLEAQGRTHEAALKGLAEEIRQRRETLTQLGTPEAEREGLVAEFERSARARLAFNQASHELELEMNELATRRAEIQADVRAGDLSALAGEQAILAAERERLEVVRQLAERLLAAAEATGDPEAVARARAAVAETRNLGVQLDAAARAYRDAVESGISDFLTGQLDQVRSLDEAWRSLARSIANAVQRVAGERIARVFTDFLFGGSKPARFARGGLVRAAGGGLVRGPGTGTSDSVPALLSRGEFVVPARAVTTPGALDLLETLSHTGWPEFNIKSSSFAAYMAENPSSANDVLRDGPASAEVSGSITIVLGDGLKATDLTTPEGQKVLIKALNKNARMGRRALGFD